ncbi:MAG: ribonuclease III [Mycoplasmoidaceae bacterium]
MKKNRKEIKFILSDLKIDSNVNIETFVESMTHKSFRNENPNIKKDFERLEILGDSIVQKIVTEYLFEKYPEKNESNITDDRKLIVQTETMKRASDQLGLIDYAFLGKGINPENDTGNIRPDLFESLIGAVYLECGEEKCKEIILMTIIDYFLKDDLNSSIDYKSKFQELIQSKESSKKNKSNYIFYKAIEENNNFKVELIVKGITYGFGNGKTKKSAEQEAAKYALSKYSYSKIK